MLWKQPLKKVTLNRRKEIIEKEIALKELSGLLNTYTTAYNTISRIVALRTYGGEK